MESEKEFLKNYNIKEYERPSVTADVAAFMISSEDKTSYRRNPDNKLRLLLIKRGGHPYIGQWALPGGFVEPDEATEQAAKRELLEETGVDNVYLEQLYTFSDPGRDPRMWVMSCSYMALIDGSDLEITAGDDAEKALWFDINMELKDEETHSDSNGMSRKETFLRLRSCLIIREQR